MKSHKTSYIDVFDIDDVFTSSGIRQEFREELARLLQLNAIWIRVLWRQPSVTERHHPRHGINSIVQGG